MPPETLELLPYAGVNQIRFVGSGFTFSTPRSPPRILIPIKLVGVIIATLAAGVKRKIPS